MRNGVAFCRTVVTPDAFYLGVSGTISTVQSHAKADVKEVTFGLKNSW